MTAITNQRDIYNTECLQIDKPLIQEGDEQTYHSHIQNGRAQTPGYV